MVTKENQPVMVSGTGAAPITGAKTFHPVQPEPEEGFCYLAFFDARHHEDAAHSMGAYPTVADLRRFANSRPFPYALHPIGLELLSLGDQVVAHVTQGDLPTFLALAALDKSLLVGAGAPGARPFGFIHRQLVAFAGAESLEVDDDPFHVALAADDGFCYLSLFGASHRTHIAQSLGPHPTVAALRKFVNSAPVPYAATPVGMDFRMRNGRAVAHVVPGCLPPAAALAALGRGVTVGSASSDKVVASLGVEHAASAPASSGPLGNTGLVRNLPFVCTLATDGGRQDATVSFNGNFFTELFGAFESVTLLSCDVGVTVRGDATAAATMAFTGFHVPPADTSGYMSAQVGMLAAGADGEVTRGILTLPHDHAFGREIKGVAVGNAVPHLHVALEAENPSTAWFRGVVSVAMSGPGNPVPVRVMPHRATPKAARAGSATR